MPSIAMFKVFSKKPGRAEVLVGVCSTLRAAESLAAAIRKDRDFLPQHTRIETSKESK